jgi:putative hydrolase of the HAD superfamily
LKRPGIVFDLDETLHDRHASIDGWARRLREAFAARTAFDESAFVALVHRLDANGRRDREQFFAQVAAQGFQDVDTGEVRAHFGECAWTSPVLFPNVVPTLEALRRRGLPIGIVTNGSSASQNAKIRNSPLVKLVDAYLVSGDLGVRKPDRAIFLRIMDALSLDAAASWFVGDDPTLDVWGAAQAGMKAAWIPRRVAWPDNLRVCHDARLADIAEVPTLL